MQDHQGLAFVATLLSSLDSHALHQEGLKLAGVGESQVSRPTEDVEAGPGGRHRR